MIGLAQRKACLRAGAMQLSAPSIFVDGANSATVATYLWLDHQELSRPAVLDRRDSHDVLASSDHSRPVAPDVRAHADLKWFGCAATRLEIRTYESTA
jgi:hypothetical protein